jgi:hypothetical protein
MKEGEKNKSQKVKDKTKRIRNGKEKNKRFSNTT